MTLFSDKKKNNKAIGKEDREREDFNMIEKIREYKMNGSLIIGVDAGYGNFKTARRVFPTAVKQAYFNKKLWLMTSRRTTSFLIFLLECNSD